MSQNPVVVHTFSSVEQNAGKAEKAVSHGATTHPIIECTAHLKRTCYLLSIGRFKQIILGAA